MTPAGPARIAELAPVCETTWVTPSMVSTSPPRSTTKADPLPAGSVTSITAAPLNSATVQVRSGPAGWPPSTVVERAGKSTSTGPDALHAARNRSPSRTGETSPAASTVTLAVTAPEAVSQVCTRDMPAGWSVPQASNVRPSPEKRTPFAGCLVSDSG
jgi:hypothetical protein